MIQETKRVLISFQSPYIVGESFFGFHKLGIEEAKLFPWAKPDFIMYIEIGKVDYFCILRRLIKIWLKSLKSLNSILHVYVYQSDVVGFFWLFFLITKMFLPRYVHPFRLGIWIGFWANLINHQVAPLNNIYNFWP